MSVIFNRGDTVTWLEGKKPFFKSDIQNYYVQKLSVPATVHGTRTFKRFPSLMDHENNEYFQMLTFLVDNETISLPANRFKLTGD